MGHKVHPVGFRLGVIRDWQAKWYSDKHYLEFLQEDLKIRKAIKSKYDDAGISLVEIDRQANMVSVTIYTARPGVVIGRGGQRVDEMRRYLESLIEKRIQVNIQEIRQPELDAYLVAKTIAGQIERRIAYRRAMKQAMSRTIQSGAKGIRVSCAGRLGGAEIARRQVMHEGQVPLHTLRADIDYGFTEARTTLGRIGVKVWINKGQVLPEPKVEEEEVPVETAVAEGEGIEPVTVAGPVEEPVATEAVVEGKAEEKPVKRATRKKKAEEPVAAEAAVEGKAEEKPVKRVTRKKKAEEPEAAETTSEAEASVSAEEEEKDVTT
jgi:small subunit ribosomal protein S3